MKTLKYPLYFFLALVVAKFGYTIVESFYNYHVLITTTSAQLSQDALEELNRNGHRISSIGITLLIVPFLYLLVKKYSDKIIYAFLIVATIITYNITYSLLNDAIDNIVKSNKDKRHDAYYVNIFKYGLLNNIFAYNSFIDNKKVQDDNLGVNDRILLTNSFLLLHADKNLIDRLKQKGKEKVADIYISKNKKEEYEKDYKAYKDATVQIQNLWNEFNKNRQVLNNKIKEYSDESLVRKAHKELLSTLKNNYKKYRSAWDKVDYKIKLETSQDKLNIIGKDLDKYFRYESYSRAKRQYEDKMNEEFGHYIKPSRWKDSSGELTYAQIKKVITSEIMKKATKKLKGLPKGLSQKQFAFHIDTQVAVAKSLREKGIEIPYPFNYTYKQFKKYYTRTVNIKINKAPDNFYTKLEKKIGKNDIKLSMTWNDFMNSSYIKTKIRLKLNTTNDKDIKTIIKAIKSKDLANFKKMIYLPKVIKEVEAMMYKPEDFKDGGKAEKIGDEAIKLLYIPPFALSVSIIALLLNIITLVGLGLIYTKKVPSIAIWGAKISLGILFIILPMISSYDGFDNKFIKKASTSEIQTYLGFLNWISYYESINYRLHK